MKKLTGVFAALFMALLLAACGTDAEMTTSTPAMPPSSDSTQNSFDSEITNEPTDNVTDSGESGGQTGAVDLTVLSSTMVYAEVCNMMITPDAYIGRTIKMSGQFAVYAETESGPYYYACVIADATACCQQGIEFVLADTDLAYPEDYPELGAAITVTGEFQTYRENGVLYCHLVDACFD